MTIKCQKVDIAAVVDWMGWDVYDLIMCCQKKEIHRLKFIDELNVDLTYVYNELCKIYYGDVYKKIQAIIEKPSLAALRSLSLIEPVGEDIYENYRFAFHLGKVSHDFDKPYKLYGVMLAKEKWKKRLTNDEVQPYSNEEIMSMKPWHFCIETNILRAFTQSFLDNYKGETFWCFMTSIVSEPIIRKDSSYPLATPADIMKIYAIGSTILDEEARHDFYVRIANIFQCHFKEDIEKWTESICVCNKTYRYLLDKAYKKKKKYVFND
jgi:hypothetical protein